MTSAYVAMLLAGLRREGLQGEVTIQASTLIAQRLQQTGVRFTEPDPDQVQDVVSAGMGLTVRWQHVAHLPAGTVAWRAGAHLRVIAVASLFVSG